MVAVRYLHSLPRHPPSITPRTVGHKPKAAKQNPCCDNTVLRGLPNNTTMIENDQYYLVTADNWFIATDGDEYRGVWGKCKVVKVDDAFGFVPQRPSTNWFLYIGEGENQVILAGCQIHYAVKCKTKPVKKIGTHDMPNTQTDKTNINKIFFTE